MVDRKSILCSEKENMKCDFDCFNCKFEDCINDDIRIEDYKQSDIITNYALTDRLDNKEILFKEKKKAYNKAYYEANKEKLKAYSKAYREANKSYHKAHYEANKEKLKAYSKAHYEANKEKIKAYNKAYYEANKEKLKAYRKAYRKRQKYKALSDVQEI